MTTQRSCTAMRISVAFALWVAVAAKANCWSQLSPSGTAPIARSGHTSVWSDVADGMYVFGGYNGTRGHLNDSYFYDRQANCWSQLSPSGTAPKARKDHAAMWSDVADGMYVFGGYGTRVFGRGAYVTRAYFNDLYFYDRQANRWNQLSPSGTAPTVRIGHTAVWSDVADGMYVFGGYIYPRKRLNDSYFYDRQANRWNQLSPSGTAPAARRYHTSVWSDVADGMYVFGGNDRGGETLNDFHFYDRQANRWSQLSPSGTAPAARRSHTSVWSDVADGMYVFGGYDGKLFGNSLNDFHFYDRQLRRSTSTTAFLSPHQHVESSLNGSNLFDETSTRQPPTTPSTSSTSTALTAVAIGDQDESGLMWILVFVAMVALALAVALAGVTLRCCQLQEKGGYRESNGLGTSERTENSMSSFPAPIVPVPIMPDVGPSEVIFEATETLVALEDAQDSPASASGEVAMTLPNSDDPSTPLGIQICKAVDVIYSHLQCPESANGDADLEACCRAARRESAPVLLKQSIFGLMQPDDIKYFLTGEDHRMWIHIRDQTENFLKLLEDPGGDPERPKGPPLVSDDNNPEVVQVVKNLRQTRPVVMDHTVREPATTTPFGHTGYMKYLCLQIVQKMHLRNIAISGQYYGWSYTPETQILEWMRLKKQSMDGMIIMFAPGKDDRQAGIQCIKDFNVPNAFLDLTMKASIRFKQTDFVASVIEAVEELDKIFKGMEGVPEDPWRADGKVNSTAAKGEVSLNLVDLMEFCDLQHGGGMNPEKQKEAEAAFRTWKKSEIFRRRVVAILTEESRGLALNSDYRVIVKWLREHFPVEEKYRVLVHAHAGDGNLQDAASIEAVGAGANGVWSAIIPQAALSGHNSSLVFLDNLLKVGNEFICKDYWIHEAAECARHIYYLNFNTFHIPDDCPVWGGRAKQEVHRAFRTVGVDDWRPIRQKYFDEWGIIARAQLKSWRESGKRMAPPPVLATGDFRIAPLVSDVGTWRRRLCEARAVGAREYADNYVHDVRDLGFALMNAGIRVNLNEEKTLKKLVQIVKDNKEQMVVLKSTPVAKCLKAEQHQGEGE